MIIKTKGLCLHTTKYGETSVIAQIFTEEKGLQSYIISGVRTRKPKVHPSLLQPLTLLDIVAYHRPEKQLFRTKELRPYRTFEQIPFEIAKSAVCLFASEILLQTLRSSEAPEDLFQFVEKFVFHLDSCDNNIANLPAFFLIKMIDFLGCSPEPQLNDEAYFFEFTTGEFLAQPPEHEGFCNPEVSKMISDLMQCSLQNYWTNSSSKLLRNYCLDALLLYLQNQTQHFKNVTSHHILKELFKK